jgi:hypothetical protein
MIEGSAGEESLIAYFQPLLFLLGKHSFFDHPRLNRNTRKAFKPKPHVTVKFAFRLVAVS